MITTRCFYVFEGCWIAFDIRWDVHQNFIHARDALAKRLHMEFMYSEDLP